MLEVSLHHADTLLHVYGTDGVAYSHLAKPPPVN